MKKYSVILFISLFSFHATSQNIQSNKSKKTYISLKDWRKKFNTPLTKTDSLNFLFINNDTLVLVENIKRDSGRYVEYEFKDSTFLKKYKKVTFRDKEDTLKLKNRMKYWKKPIKIFFSKSIPHKIRNEIISFSDFISKGIDSLKIYQTKILEESNYIIYSNTDYEYDMNLVNQKSCDYYLYWNSKSQIVKAAIKIDTIEQKYMSSIINKLKQSFFQSLGHFKLNNEFNCKSFLSDCNLGPKEVNPLDLEILKYHYSYGICKGTDLNKFEESHKKAKKLLVEGKPNMRFFHPYPTSKN